MNKQALLDFVVFALWPIIIAEKVYKDWFYSLAEISSTEIAKLVAHWRLSLESGDPLSPAVLMTALSNVHFYPGLINMIDDLSDPKRGAGALTALAIFRSIEPPPRDKSSEATAFWIFKKLGWVAAAAGAGVVGNRADAIVVSLWHGASLAPVASSGGGQGSQSSSGQNFAGGSGAQHAGGSGDGLLSIIESLFR